MAERKRSKARDAEPAVPPAPPPDVLVGAVGDVRTAALVQADQIDKVIRLLSGPENYVADVIIHLERVAATLRTFHQSTLP